MISNNTTVKIKASKSSKDVPNEYETYQSDDNGETNSIEGDAENGNHRYVYNRDVRYKRVAGRPRSTEYRSTRLNERRGAGNSYRGRGAAGRRAERDTSDFYVLNRKYDYSSRNTDNAGSYNKKYHENLKKSEIKLNFPEDTRISKLLRRLSIENDPENSLTISRKLLEVLLLPDNSTYVRKAFHILNESMYDILQVSPGPAAKQQAARALGRMGYIMGQENDFERYQNWLFLKLNNTYDEMQILLMKSFKETLALEKDKPVLQNNAERLIHHLVTSLETTENVEVFKVILDVLMTTVEIYPESFFSQFRDTVDLLIGWHIDYAQPLDNIEFISKNLQRIAPHFKFYMQFAVSLIENFLEDISSSTDQLNDAESNAIERTTPFILALNTVLKCLGQNFQPNNNKYVTVDLIMNCLTQIIKTATDALELCIPDNLVIAANESIGILLTHLDTKTMTLSNTIYNLIDLELSFINDFCDATVISLLILISKVIKELSANLQPELIEKLIGPQSALIKLRSSHVEDIQESVISVYQSLLILKNVSLLQEAYRYVLGDLEVAYRAIIPDLQPFIPNNPFGEMKRDNSELTVLFLLRCLSQLATASSIIVMWALKPSILELGGVLLEPHNKLLIEKTPALHYGLVYLLYSHCKCYNHFISSSNLVSKKDDQKIIGLFGDSLNDLPNTSPNSENFALILDVLTKTLSASKTSEVTLLLLQWLNDILANADSYLENFYDNEKFVPITQVLVKCGYDFNAKIVVSVCENLEKLLSNKQLSWNQKFLLNITDLCKLHMKSNNQLIRDNYTRLSVNIPWDVALMELNRNNYNHKKTLPKQYSNDAIYSAQYLNLNGTIYGELQPLHFKSIMDYLLKNEENLGTWLEDIFTCCWSFDNDSNQYDTEFFYDLGVNSRNVLYNWTTSECAQFCVNYKLRTPLGKPNETFTKIEGALNELGNDLLNFDKRTSYKNYKRVVLLLQFIEHLEKSIYNAAEGCAISMPQSTKQVRSFFTANSNTCNEWMNRIRLVVMHIALHAGDPCVALRHGQALLAEYANHNKSNIELERIAMFVTLTLLDMQESEAIHGLYVWCKTNLGRKLSWIKYAADQAAKRYEIAIVGYRNVLQETTLDADVLHFIHDQISLCYKDLGRWMELMEWKDEIKSNGGNGRRYTFSVIDWDCIENLYHNDDGNYSFIKLNSWGDENEQTNTWSEYHNLTKTETSLLSIAFDIASDHERNYKEDLEKSLNVIGNSIQNHLNYAPSNFLQNYTLMYYVANGLKNVLDNTSANSVFLVSETFEDEMSRIDSNLLRKILWWSEFFGNLQNQNCSIFCTKLNLDLIKRARKEKNFNLAVDYIRKYLKNGKFDDELSNRNLALQCITKVKDVPHWTIEMAKVFKEIIKLSYATDEPRSETFNLCAATSTTISKHAELFNDLELKKISSKILLKLANWLQVNEQISVTEMNSPLSKLLMVLPDIGMMDNTNSNIIPMNELAIGKLLQFSVHHCNILARSWMCFGTWCYRWGKKMVDHGSDIRNKLTEDECTAIKNLLPPDVSEESLLKIFEILSQTRSHLDDEDIDSNDINTSEMIQNQLLYVDILRNATEFELQNLVQIWRNTQKRIYTYYALSADAYFRYLHLTLNTDNITKSTECSTITVTLRLLRLIVKYALELQNILEEGLKTTPTRPWKVIIPQLFSRLNHPENYVRLRVSDLLCRVAEDAPHLITFPAVVGALEGGVKFDFSEITLPKDCLSQNNECQQEDDLNDEEDNYESDHEDCSNALQSCFKTMVDTLSKQDPETISQVQTLVKELRRITLLWDELWLGTLAQHQSDIVKRQQQLDYEIEKVNENVNLSKDEKASLISEKHRIIIKPIIFVLEQLKEVTSVEAETPHEKQFQEKYSKDINEVIEKLKKPDNPEKPQDSLQHLRTLQKKFQQKFHKRASYTLKMQDISPVLASIKDTLIAMPGLPATKTNVTISHVSNIVSILPTKTKPKKLIFYGSDGQTYTYLFKGLEDLHLDERIMQFLSIANTMMAENSQADDRNLYRARHYSVIPLGPRSGLISWVDGTTPVFALYKRWQQREIVKPNTKNTNGTTSTNTTILRPSEMFYNKLNPLLKEHGVKNLENRKEWPLSVLKQVLSELMAETPSDLLAKELWCNATSAKNWWQVVKRYSYSVAVMSIIGYIIGLGDRHLDNVLIDLSSGEVVHIDYNVCFEKGKTLRVPEKVPFRLTPNIRDALGVTGVEGIFRTACENVMKTMRKGRETLLTLLEAFVYDPLIDWTIGGEVLAGTTFGALSSTSNWKQNKKDLEKEVTLSMFNVRCTEMRIEWNENKEKILISIPPLVLKLKSYLGTHAKISASDDLLQDLHQQMALVKEAEARGGNKHPLYNLPSRYTSYCKSQETIKNARRDLEKIIIDSEKHIIAYHEALSQLNGPQFNDWIANMKVEISLDNSIFDLVREFLHNAGKNEVVAQCEKSEDELVQLSQQQNMTAIRCLQLLQDFNVLLNQCPKSYIENHRMLLFLKWSKFLLEDRTVDGCDHIYEQFRSFLDLSNSQHVLQYTYSLETFYKETVAQVHKLLEELTKISSSEMSATLEKMYANAKLGITTFLNYERGAIPAFQFVIANELVLLNKTFLTLETTASRSGDLLIKLTSREGDWFLNDLVLNSTKAVELIKNLPLPQNGDHENFLKALNGIKLSNNVYKGLQELHYNFHTIILLESMKKIQSEEITTLQMIAELQNLITDIGMSIPELILQLEKILPCLYMQMDINPSCEHLLKIVDNVRLKYKFLLHSDMDLHLNPGKMLLMGFNGLFDTLTQEMNNLIAVLGNLDAPICWKKLDQVKEAKTISGHIFDPKIHAILEDIFLLKQLHTMSEFFNLALEMCHSLKDSGKIIIYNDDQLLKPVRQYIADFISRKLLGISTESIAYSICFILQYLGLDVTHEIEQKDIGAESKVPLDEMVHKAWNHFLKQGIFTQNVLSQASSLETSLKLPWEKMQEPKKIDIKFTMLKSSALRLQNQLTLHNFMYEEILNQLHVFTTTSTVRSKFIGELKNEMGTLKTIGDKLKEARAKQRLLIEKAHQRLNWAKGANPNVNEISAAFESALEQRDARLDLEQKISDEIMQVARIILQHEQLRIHCVESKNCDKLFLNTLDVWKMACQYSGSKNDVLTPTEESIMNLLNDEMLKNPKWLQEIADVISDKIQNEQAKLNDEKSNLFCEYDKVVCMMEEFKAHYNTHCRLMGDVKGLIKTMTKLDDVSEATQRFVMDYRAYIEYFVALFATIKKGSNVNEANEALKLLDELAKRTETIYEMLMGLETKKRPPLVRQDCVVVPAMVTKQESTTKGQQRNAYAVGVWRRVKMKLEGRDPDPGRKYTPQEQVDYVIREATNLDNLALLYEGWTPWV